MNDYQDVDFWRGRMTAKPQDAPGYPDNGFDTSDVYYRKFFSMLIPIDAKVLDAGCGVGRLAEWFADYTGFDFVPEFVKTASELYPHKRFLVADFNAKLPFGDKAFDWGVMVSTNQYYKGEELDRVCKNVLILSYNEPYVATIRSRE